MKWRRSRRMDIVGRRKVEITVKNGSSQETRRYSKITSATKSFCFRCDSPQLKWKYLILQRKFFISFLPTHTRPPTRYEIKLKIVPALPPTLTLPLYYKYLYFLILLSHSTSSRLSINNKLILSFHSVILRQLHINLLSPSSHRCMLYFFIFYLTFSYYLYIHTYIYTYKCMYIHLYGVSKIKLSFYLLRGRWFLSQTNCLTLVWSYKIIFTQT